MFRCSLRRAQTRPTGHTRHVSPLLARTVVVAMIAGTAAVATHSAHSATGKLLIDVGGSGGSDGGSTWQADTGYTGGTTSKSTATISGTSYQSTFQSQRAGMSAYSIAVTSGTYYVKLLESEHSYTAAGKRVFDVTAEGKLVEDNVDVYKQAGGANKALFIVFQTTVTDGTLNLGFTASVGTTLLDGLVIEPTTSTQPPPPSGSVLWGMQDDSSYDSIEKSSGRTFALAREYRRIDQSFTNSRMVSLANSGHSMVLSVRADTVSGHVKYADITAGKWDSTFLKGFAAVNGLKTKTFFIFQHEPESTDAKGSCSTSTGDSVCGPQFVAAWKHVYNLAKAHGYTRLIFSVTLEAYSFHRYSNYRWKYYWPGSAYTDWIGIDAYNSNCDHGYWSSFTEMMEYAVDWLKANAPTKSVIMPEYGAQEWSSSTQKATFFNGVPTSLSQPGYKQIKALTYWNNTITSSCNYKFSTSTSSSTAYKNLGLNAMMSAKAPT